MGKIRCAIYTRKSTEEGLDMELNSLDVQREAAENYIKSQVNEGWVVLPEHYDDGGFSGGNINRPAFQKLMKDVENGLVDMIVVYKIDRLTRSLIDFSRMVEVFDKNNVSFVSVTQQFNTSTSMGRLTLNVLLSFAQFEREVGSERTRDKIAASKQKGMWMGGPIPLGYDIQDKKLIINQAEAELVRLIFDKYIELQSYWKVAQYLNVNGYHHKKYISRSGIEHGGREFDKASIFNIMKNPLYLGRVRHKNKEYDGQHEAIISVETWNMVRKIIEAPYQTRKIVNDEDNIPLLKGILKCGCCDRAMIHTIVKKGNNRGYRYYVSVEVMKKSYEHCKIGNVPAKEIEDLIIDEVKKLLQTPEVISQTYQEVLLLDDKIDEQLFINRMKNFSKVWDYLYPIEVRKIVQSLIKQVIIYENKIEVQINIKGLNSKIKEYANDKLS